MINNNRQAGRRRGRGGQRQGGNPAGNGNRIDNRARGNAAQLLEKYKALAADAQRQGDRVNAEYYLQFADHYFRVLAESRSRFEEQNQQRRGREDSFEDEDEGFDEDGTESADAEPRRQGRDDQQRRDRDDRGNRDQRRERGDREDRGNRPNGAQPANDSDDGEAEPAVAEQPRRLRPRRESRPVAANEGESFDPALLPPSLGMSTGDEGEPAKPRRPRRRPAAEETADAAE